MRCKTIKKFSKKQDYGFYLSSGATLLSIVFGMNLKVHKKNPARKAARAAEFLRFIKFLHGSINIWHRSKILPKLN